MRPAVPSSPFRAWRHLMFRWRREKLHAELAQEIEFHRLLMQAENQRSGLSPEAADALSHRQMGNTTITREECRDMWSFVGLEKLVQDIRYATRIFRRTPG